MELGNMIFGNSRGEVGVPHGGKFEGPWQELCDELKINWRGYADDGCLVQENADGDLETEVFKIRSYDWNAECDCGADDAMEAWFSANEHEPNCYQSVVRSALKAWSAERGLSGDTWEWPDYARIAIRDFEDAERKRLCSEMGLSYPDGCAVHCTCGHDDKALAEWARIGGHKSTCRFVQPNFLYKPTGFRINWYKYPFRDSYMTPAISAADWQKIVRHCIAETRQKSAKS